MEDSIAQLEEFCAGRENLRFAPDEMVELLEDGETVGWIVEQVLPEGAEEEIRELTGMLESVAAQVAPEPVEEEAEAEEESEAGVEPAAEEEALEADPEEEMLDLEQLRDLPLPPGVDMKQVEQLLASPQGEMLNDFGAFCQERGVDAEGGEEGMEEMLRELHDEWLQTPRASLDGKRPAELLDGGTLLPRKVETFRRETPKVGRNDPCPCGSGKKYKKCCGKAG